MKSEEMNSKGNGVAFVLAVFVASRIFYLVSGSVLAQVVPTSNFQRATLDVPSGSMNIWSHWDGEHYVMLALGGYLNPPENVSPAFFPLYPLLVRSFAELLGGPISLQALSLWAPLISLLLLPFALYFLYHIALDGWGERVARGTVLALAFFPTTFFLNSAYTESVFLALSAGSLWAMRVRRDLLLGVRVWQGWPRATRNVGVFLVVPLFVEWIRREHGAEYEVARGIPGAGTVGADCVHGVSVAPVWRSPALLLRAEELGKAGYGAARHRRQGVGVGRGGSGQPL